MLIEVDSAAGTRAVAQRLAPLLRAGDLVILSGELGAGKTTFTQALGAALGVRPGIISPTFVLVRIHPSLVNGPDLVHVDAYRLDSAAEIDDIDLEESLDRSVTVVEWGEDRVEHLSDSYLRLRFVRSLGVAGPSALDPDPELDEDEEVRQIEIQAVGPRWAGVDLGVLAG
ncbi:tRNA (adenosine(37)-N6)-threonylcarbamoyltransferase complex ATPase subunit type 1 TsaE [Psychromicrobium xiongbiense]|uniref:tRNA (adenosine(37)-N6)-threonylcarbamoyltransferase complex ATPase subunit type 1 TsaE n=1 Tax=Psychromicrobium xiongbiense TaxID=3051184 RepID=UPI002552F97F|nr:tRNA (adenosine(37)-N6)-threonylcarbamoyltransferase complex ATPase subunit type 1 TsaE [Psychromicrobium sp. YIM S02556]